MDLVGLAKRVRIYVNEGDLVHHKPAHLAILELLRRNDAAGATVLRAVEGFGGSGQVHTTRLTDAEWKLPVVIEWVDSRERVERLLPLVKQLVVRGLITVDDTEIALFSPLPVRDLPSSLTAGDAMRAEVRTVGPETATHELVQGLVADEPQGAVCVVEGGVPIGIITSSDLVSRGGLGVRVKLLSRLQTPELEAELQRLAASRLTARQIMTAPPVTVHVGVPLPEVATEMTRRQLRRLPVVDDRGHLVGLVRRVDVLRAVAERFEPGRADAPLPQLAADTPLARVVRTNVPIVHPDTPLPVAMQAVIATSLNCAIVVDADRHPVGIVTDAEVLDRVNPALRPSALRSLVHRLPFVHPDAQTVATEQHALARTAADLMSVDLAVLASDAPLSTAIESTLGARTRIVAVVDSEGRLVGIVDHADLLRGLVDAQPEPAG